ncbi:hypothetical protein, partial [uncultured Muribaculum sp.]|uniref:hypothetical protein n=1 Tax=uncultured Muribaculum sp. TaxID=1918613 RepID=UPI0026658B09
IAGAFPSVCQSCTSSTFLPRRPKIAPPYATLPLIFIVEPALKREYPILLTVQSPAIIDG